MKRATMMVITLLTTALVVAWALPVLGEQEQLVNINVASVEELMTLEGIGEKYARRIIEFREKNGPFEYPEEIIEVKGIGEKTFALNKDRITVRD